MAYKGHVSLDGNEYRLVNLPIQTLANQMAPPIGQGTSTYADLTSWAAWIQETWEEGSGKLDPHKKAGMLYSEAESRVPSQLILPGLIRQVDKFDLSAALTDCRFMPQSMAGTITLGDTAQGAEYGEVAMRITTPAIYQFDNLYVWFYLRAENDAVIEATIRNVASNLPTTEVYSSDVTINVSGEGFAWYGINLQNFASPSTSYFVTLDMVSGTAELAYATSGYAQVAAGRANSGASWSNITGKYLFFSTQFHALDPQWYDENTRSGFFRLGSTLYCWTGRSIYKYSTANDNWVLAGTTSATEIITSAVAANGNAYFGVNNNSDDYVVMSGAEVLSAGSTSGQLMARGSGYLWSMVDNQVYYSADGVNWTTTDEMFVGSIEYPIRSMCEMGGEMYCATNEGLYRIAPGDFTVGVAPWSDINENNGKFMVNHEGNLYITVNNRIIRYGMDGTFQDVWMSRDSDVLQDRLGSVLAIGVCNSWLVAIVGADSLDRKPTVWAMQGSSWHHLATLPQARTNLGDYTQVEYSLYYDRTTSHLWMMAPTGITYKLYVPDHALNPYNDDATRYMPAAWVEWDWFDGPILEAQKDFESVAIMGENISATTPVYVYWQDDSSTDWELLGAATSNYHELIWSDAATRPNTRRLKLGILLRTSDGSETPRIRAIRVKYTPMIKDWFRWQLQIDVSGDSFGMQEGLDGAVNTRTASALKSSLDVLATQVAPFVYEDVDGSQYEVKVKDANLTYTKLQYNSINGNKEWEAVYSFTLEQVRPGVYTS